MDHLPPCCASCPELDQRARACRLLAEPTPANRQRLYSMPCDARRLLRQRFRGHGEDVAKTAIAVWEAVDVAADGVGATLEPPIDARAWLSAWPVSALAGGAIKRRLGTTPQIGDPLPPPGARVFHALAALHRIDPISHLLLLEGMRGTFEAATWRASLGVNDATLGGYVALAALRGLVLLFGVVPRIEPLSARTCFTERWLSPTGRAEVAALSKARGLLGDPMLTMTVFRQQAQEGALAALALLEREPGLSVALTHEAVRSFRRVLKLDPESDEAFAFEEPVFALLARELADAGPRGPDGHVSPQELVGFALTQDWGQAAPRALVIVEHLSCCRDDRCANLVRAEIAGTESVRRMLAGPIAEPSWLPPPGASVGPSSPRMIRCRDVLWETFTSMAQAEGRSVDDLVDEAMDRYRLLRTHVGGGAPSSRGSEPAIPKPTSSRPPSTGLRLGSKSSRPPEPAVPEADGDDDRTEPRRPRES